MNFHVLWSPSNLDSEFTVQPPKCGPPRETLYISTVNVWLANKYFFMRKKHKIVARTEYSN